MKDPLTPLTPEETKIHGEQGLKQNYFKRVLVATDVFVNVLTGGIPDTTISSRTAWDDEHGSKVGRVLSWTWTKIGFGKNHGAGAVAADMAKAERAAKYEEDSHLVNIDKP